MTTNVLNGAREFLTSDQVIQRLLSNAALRRRASTCVLQAVRVGGEWKFRRADLEAWIAAQFITSSAGELTLQ